MVRVTFTKTTLCEHCGRRGTFPDGVPQGKWGTCRGNGWQPRSLVGTRVSGADGGDTLCGALTRVPSRPRTQGAAAMEDAREHLSVPTLSLSPPCLGQTVTGQPAPHVRGFMRTQSRMHRRATCARVSEGAP